jgi:hypothetical protein
VEQVLPVDVQEFSARAEEPSAGDLPEDTAELAERGAELEPDFTDQSLSTDPADVVQGDASTYFPPTDPVVKPDAHGDPQIVGGFEPDAMADDRPARRPVSGGTPDEALADLVRRELVEDAATTDLEVDVEVEDGIAYLRGRVDDLVDSDNALAVAGRVPGVVDVVDELTIEE